MLSQGAPLSKRIFDLLMTTIGLCLISPFILILMLVVWFQIGSPIFFKQRRPGYQGKLFYIYKFRTMTNQTDERGCYGNPGDLLPDELRLTRLGRFLRSSSLDELPELYNVLRGEMSLVGPRPLLIQYLERYTAEQARRHDVLPGITGWAQIHGRNALTWEDKFRLDVWYVDHWSFRLDILILIQTLGKVIRREGISQPGHATAEEFMGSPSLEQIPANGKVRDHVL